VRYAVEHFAECSVELSFLELPCDAVAELVGSDELPVKEEQVLAAVRAWFDHDAVGRAESLKERLPLVRWPLLPVPQQLQLANEPLLLRLMLLGEQQSCALGLNMMLECSAEFAASDAAAACPRLKRRKGTVPPVLPLAFTALSQEHYAVSEDGALLTTIGDPGYHPALCHERVMNSGQSCAEVTVVHEGTEMMIGVGRPTLDPDTENADDTAHFWGIYSKGGRLFHNRGSQDWQGQQDYGTGDVLRLLLDSDAGTLIVKKNGTLLGMAVTSGLTGDLCWAVSMYADENEEEDRQGSVRIKALDPAEF
jgi:hypothetical protein